MEASLYLSWTTLYVPRVHPPSHLSAAPGVSAEWEVAGLEASRPLDTSQTLCLEGPEDFLEPPGVLMRVLRTSWRPPGVLLGTWRYPGGLQYYLEVPGGTLEASWSTTGRVLEVPGRVLLAGSWIGPALWRSLMTIGSWTVGWMDRYIGPSVLPVLWHRRRVGYPGTPPGSSAVPEYARTLPDGLQEASRYLLGTSLHYNTTWQGPGRPPGGRTGPSRAIYRARRLY